MRFTSRELARAELGKCHGMGGLRVVRVKTKPPWPLSVRDVYNDTITATPAYGSDRMTLMIRDGGTFASVVLAAEDVGPFADALSRWASDR